jgi:hypothetical protein
MEQLSVWVGAGLVTAGVSAALIAGAGVAAADTGSDSGSSGASAGSSDSGAGTSDSAGEKKDTEKKDTDKPAAEPAAEPSSAQKPDTDEATGGDETASAPTKKTKKKSTAGIESKAEPEPAASEAPPATNVADTVAEPEVVVESPKDAVAKNSDTQPVTAKLAAPAVMVQAPPVPQEGPLEAVAHFVGSVVQSVVAPLIVNVGSLAINALQAAEALVTGPPMVPPNSTVTVRSSTILLSNGQRVAANWFYPAGDGPPKQMILLQHGFLALGPMYSYTAATLAEQTHSIVVTPTLSSNPFAGDALWLGGTAMSAAIADLFVGDRTALTASAVDAGYATRYGLNPNAATLPEQFGLAGHSLGANLVSGAAGFLAENGGADHLVGVLLLDGVPLGDTLASALGKLDVYEAATHRYIPIREIGAPPNLFNSFSDVNEVLSAMRPNRFNGVVLIDGVHMDSMRGANPLIQFAAYVAAGFPQPQNPPAVDSLATTWFGQWFGGKTNIGDDLVPGATIDIPTPQGTAHGVVIGNPPAAVAATSLLESVALAPSTPTTLPEVNPRLATVAA